MRKDLYVSFTDYDYLREFIENNDFVSVAEYDTFELEKTSPCEYGKLRLDNMYLHLIADSGICPNCPWCDCGVQEVVLEMPEYEVEMVLITFAKVYARCMNCLARGPVLNIRLLDTEDKIVMDEYKEFVRHRWGQRIKRNPEIMGKQ